jgi:hypothetical protein
MPFSKTDFFDVFALYNDAVWPAQILLYVLAAGSVLGVMSKSAGSIRGVYAILAILWLWMGVVYHSVFFAAINPIAPAFGVVFIIQAVIFTWIAVRPQATEITPPGTASTFGTLLVVLALAGYPLFTFVAGHDYPAQPTFGLPCPTTIFTLGILLLASRGLPRVAFVIPMSWAVVGSVGAFTLGIPEDMSLSLALSATLIAIRSRLPKHPEFRHA